MFPMNDEPSDQYSDEETKRRFEAIANTGSIGFRYVVGIKLTNNKAPFCNRQFSPIHGPFQVAPPRLRFYTDYKVT